MTLAKDSFEHFVNKSIGCLSKNLLVGSTVCSTQLLVVSLIQIRFVNQFHHMVYTTLAVCISITHCLHGLPKLPFLLMVAASDGGRRSREECEGVRGSEGWC